MDTEDKKHLPYQLLIIGALLLGFFPAILHVYLFHDDLFFWDQPASRHTFPLICSESIYLGRFLGAFICWSYFFIVKTVMDLNMIRLITSLVIAYCALRTYGLLLKYLKRPIDAALCAIMLFSLPAFEVWVSHAGESFEVYALFFAIMAGYSADRIPLEGHFWERTAGRAGLLSMASLICSWMIYPSLAGFYWALALVLILAQRESESKGLRNKIWNIYIPGLAAAIFYACIYKFRKYFIKLIFVSAYQPDTMTTDIPDKILWFLGTVVPQSLNLWNIFPDIILPSIFSLFFAGAVIIKLIDDGGKGKNNFWLRATAGFLITVSLMILSYLPNLLVAINFNPYRCAAGLTAVFLIFLIWALRVYCRYIPKPAGSIAFTLILCVVCWWGISRCFNNIDHFRVKPSCLEYSFLRDSIVNFHGKLKEIDIIPPRFEGLYHYYDEFGVSTFEFNSSANVVRLMNAVITGTFVGEGMKWASYHHKPTYSYYFREPSGQKDQNYSLLKIRVVGYAKKDLPSSTLLIDMNDLYAPLKQAMGRQSDFKTLNKRSWDG